ncbi:MAG TPA: type I-E CRISPR-associated protein Cas7/Cse4/CasC [Armatimonadetes bacterium]|nr:type I-E CRISPR-associated protein Cas7/Cse4/CasC [Armatimonadota bacterium]
MWIELHILQNFAPSCLNRDDTNSPKDCVFGGYRRARISSQCIKRATRTHPAFQEAVTSGVGVRTKRLVDPLVADLTERGHDEDAAHTVATAVVNALIGKMKGDQTSVLVYLGEDEIARVVALIEDRWEEASEAAAKAEGDKTPKALQDLAKEIAKEFTPATDAADVALFGRMVAEATNWNIDAACQVAHAISTHRAEMEMDFYTAVDDLNPGEETGAGMMGTVEFNSSCFYRYALIDLDQLTKNLGGDVELARAAVDGFLRASVAAIPTGKQNSMAAQNPPSLLFAVVKDKSTMPWSLANAFEVPVDVGRNGRLVDRSAEALARYWERLCAVYGGDGVVGGAVCQLGEADLGPLTEHQVDSMGSVFGVVNEAIAAGGS